VDGQALAGGLAGRDRDPQVKGYAQLMSAFKSCETFAMEVFYRRWYWGGKNGNGFSPWGKFAQNRQRQFLPQGSGGAAPPDLFFDLHSGNGEIPCEYSLPVFQASRVESYSISCHSEGRWEYEMYSYPYRTRSRIVVRVVYEYLVLVPVSIVATIPATRVGSLRISTRTVSVVRHRALLEAITAHVKEVCRSAKLVPLSTRCLYSNDEHIPIHIDYSCVYRQP
jgi:hypothetical protein